MRKNKSSNLSPQQITKKQREREDLEEFRALYSDFPLGEIIACEEPDFLIRTDTTTIGIELLEYNRKERGSQSSLIRQKESFHESLADKAKAEFEGKHQVPLQVIFHGHGHLHSANDKQFDQLVRSAAELVASKIPGEVSGKIILGPDELADRHIGAVVHVMSIRRLKPGTQGAWSFAEAGPADLDSDELQREIATKESKVEKYLEQCSAVWLLIVTGGRHIATMAVLSDNLKQHCFESHFERILVYNRLNRSIFRLLTSKEK